MKKHVHAQMIEAAAKAMERRYHKEGGVCDERDGGPDCWKSMLGFASAGVKAALRAQRRAERRAKKGATRD